MNTTDDLEAVVRDLADRVRRLERLLAELERLTYERTP